MWEIRSNWFFAVPIRDRQMVSTSFFSVFFLFREFDTPFTDCQQSFACILPNRPSESIAFDHPQPFSEARKLSQTHTCIKMLNFSIFLHLWKERAIHEFFVIYVKLAL